MRILIVAEHASASYGGEAILPLHYFRKLRSRGIEVWMIVHGRTENELKKTLGDDFSRVFFIPDTAFVRWLSRVSKSLPARVALMTTRAVSMLDTQVTQRKLVVRLVKKYNIDVVHQPIPVSPKFPSLIFSVGAPVVIGPMNGGMTFPPGFEYLQGRSEKIITPIVRLVSHFINIVLPGKLFARLLLVANERTLKALPIFKFGQVDILVENGVDTSLFQRSEPLSSTSRKTLPLKYVYLGRLVDWKAVDLLILAFSKISNRDTELHIIGDGPERAKLEQLVTRSGLKDRVTFYGTIPQEKCVTLLSKMDILVLPSLYECGGAVVLEAMSMSIPVIATNWGGPSDYIDDSCGLLVNPGHGKEEFILNFVDAMEQFISSPALISLKGNAGAKKVKEVYDWNRKTDAILKHYLNAMENSK